MSKVFLVLLVVFFAASCEDDNGGDNTDLQALAEAKVLWELSGSDNYQITAVHSCFCEPSSKEVNIVVSNGEIHDAYMEQEFIDVFAPDSPFLSVDNMFDLIEETINRSDSEVTVTYDAVYGFPVSVYFDYDLGIADEEDSYTFSNFVTHKQALSVSLDKSDTWDSSQLISYVADITISCFCETTGTFTVSVNENEIVSVLDADGTVVDINLVSSSYPMTIAALFDFLESNYGSASAVVEVEYDELLGYPTQVFVDSHPARADDTIEIHVALH